MIASEPTKIIIEARSWDQLELELNFMGMRTEEMSIRWYHQDMSYGAYFQYLKTRVRSGLIPRIISTCPEYFFARIYGTTNLRRIQGMGGQKFLTSAGV
jgi:hypothetical protein